MAEPEILDRSSESSSEEDEEEKVARRRRIQVVKGWSVCGVL